MFREDLEHYLLMIPVLLISLTIHELSHGYIAYRLGDITAKSEGRLTLNPFKHLDPVGTIMMIVARIGWAKPVPVNPGYFRNPKKGMMLVSVAGPLSNMVMAFIGVFLFEITYALSGGNPESIVTYWLLRFLSLFFTVNIGLAIFNLLPVPPLDGSKILSGILPAKAYFQFMQYERYIGMIFLVIVLAFGEGFSKILGFFANPLAKSMIYVAESIVGLFVS